MRPVSKERYEGGTASTAVPSTTALLYTTAPPPHRAASSSHNGSQEVGDRRDGNDCAPAVLAQQQKALGHEHDTDGEHVYDVANLSLGRKTPRGRRGISWRYCATRQ